MTKRERVTAYIVQAYDKIIPGDSYNGQLIKKRLDAMSLEEFDVYMRELGKPANENGLVSQEILPFYAPNFQSPRVTMVSLMDTAEFVGHEFFEQLWLTDPQTGRVYLTPQKYLSAIMFVRRAAQMLNKKSSIPENTRHVDELSGQVTGKSKGSKISFPELQGQLAQGLDNTLIEEIKVRGGDRHAQVEFDRQLIETGEASIVEATEDGSITKSTSNTAIFLRGMMIDTNLDDV